MASIKSVFTFTTNNTSILLKNHISSFQTISNIQIRSIKFYRLIKNIQYISKDQNMSVKVDPKTMKLNRPIERPICYMFTWLNAKNPHIIKYANVYLERGFDIFNVTCDPIQIMFPTIGTQPVAKNVLKFMEQNGEFNPIVLHGFSSGGYMWGEVCKYASENISRHQRLLDRVSCQIWDSVADVPGYRLGISIGQFPENLFMQKLLYGYLGFHMTALHSISTKHYLASCKYYRKNLVKAPTLLISSKTDPISEFGAIREYKISWERLGIKVFWKCFENSPHVQHMRTHPKEYLKAVNDHLMANVPMLAH